jgi:hypothetical protein
MTGAGFAVQPNYAILENPLGLDRSLTCVPNKRGDSATLPLKYMLDSKRFADQANKGISADAYCALSLQCNYFVI